MLSENEGKVESTETTVPPTTSVSIGELATKLGTSEKRLRGFLRVHFSRDTKGGKWKISPSLAKQITKKYKTEILDPRAKKQEKLQKELEGQA
ncbi:MAG: hypothetical protein WC749_05240 [Dehalococcoidia bacterium]